MLYIYFGKDTDTVHTQTKSLIESLLKRKPDASVHKLETEQVSEAVLDELIQSQGLFSEKYIVQLNQVLETANTKEVVIKKLEQMKLSDNVFILVEHAVTAPVKKKLEAYADKIQEYTSKKEVGGYGGVFSNNAFNIFNIADAFGERDKKRFWVLLQKAYHHRIAAEEIHGTILWQLRMMLMAKQSNSAAEAGMKPFVYNKAKKYASTYSLEELKKMSRDLISLYHNVRKGEGELSVGIELFALSLK